ncbi:unnamed protein product [Linum tenue]|uniref:polynucleotide adenylyltransferase n=1 Tax=Linum tenue TaxID=586396 RepID=A0AAV0JJP9_9ROSI|nr:unnamed protein product [Linum tenue]
MVVGSQSPNVASSTQSGNKRRGGITNKVFLAGPSEADIQRNANLEKFLVDSGLYETKEEAEQRQEVLGRIDQIVKAWVKQLTRLRGYTDQTVEEANAVLFTFGSYRLGVHGPGADVDTLCVGPSYVNREEDFFIILHDLLAEMEEVTELQPVPDAHVPVMKFRFLGISIDLLYASISLLVVPEDLDISNGSVLHDVDEQTVRSLNGCRVADQILKLVPNAEEIEVSKAHWSALFEPYPFFASYKNYLQVDIIAADADDLLAWKGWVESRLRQLTLKIERDTNGMLQCHPYPHVYTDMSRQFPHCAFFTGLQRKEGISPQEGQQFDIRGTVDEFRQDINMYVFWKPGMDISVAHVRRRQLPTYVFPEGHRRSRHSRHLNQQQAGKANDDVGKSPSGSIEEQLKRKHDGEMAAVKRVKCASESPQKLLSVSPELCRTRSVGPLLESFHEVVKMGFSSNLADVDNNAPFTSCSGQDNGENGDPVVCDSKGFETEDQGGDLSRQVSSQDYISSLAMNEPEPMDLVAEWQHAPDPSECRVGVVETCLEEGTANGSSEGFLNLTRVGVEVEAVPIVPSNQTFVVLGEKDVMCSSSSNRNLNCEGEDATDLGSVLENRCPSGKGQIANGLPEELECNTGGTAMQSQDGSSRCEHLNTVELELG